MMVLKDGTELTIENLRSSLSGYSIDVQDVMRSAVLDGVNIMPYVDSCKTNPYRLDQIRLGLKEGLDEVFFAVRSGEGLYKIRRLRERGSSLKELKKHIEKGNLSDYALDRLISWVESGYNTEGLNIGIIPRHLFDVFEQGLEKGFDMKPFNTGKQYSTDYVRYCMIITSNGKTVDTFLGKGRGGLWSEESLRILAKNSKSLNKEQWEKLLNGANREICSDTEMLSVLIMCVKNGISIGYFGLKNSKGEKGVDCWSADGIMLVLKAYESGLSWKKLLDVGPDEDAVRGVYNELKLAKSKKVSGRLLKGYSKRSL